jgi:phosphoglycerate dehydrogenase-like enzyme
MLSASPRAQTAIERLVEQTGIEAGDVAVRDAPRWRAPGKIIVRADYAESVTEMAPGVEVIAVSSQAEAIRHAANADAVIGYCSQRIAAEAPELQWMQITGAGAERCVNVDGIRNGEIVLTNMQKMSSPVIAEHVTAMLLGLARGLVPYAKVMEDGAWRRGQGYSNEMQSISGKTLLVVGLGGIGTEVARRAAALEIRVTGTRRSSREGPDFVEYVGLSDELLELAAKADFIVNALPITPETSGLFDSEFFAATKRGAYFINVGRGRSVVTADLLAALESGQLAGAGLDVTDPEPLPADHPLWQLPNVIITPHVAGRGGDRFRHNTLIQENVRRFVAGDALLNVVDPELGY